MHPVKWKAFHQLIVSFSDSGVPLFQNRFSCSSGIELLRHEQCIHSGAINGDDWPFYIRSFTQHSLYLCNVPLGILSKITGSHGSNIILVGRGELKFSFCHLCLETNRQRPSVTRICGSRECIHGNE